MSHQRTRIIGARFSVEEGQLIQELAESRGLSLSQQIREAMMLHIVRVGSTIVPRKQTQKPKAAAA